MSLRVHHVSISFREKGKIFQAVQDMSFDIEPGSTVGLVGESGSGKTLTALSILNLLPKEALVTGEIEWEGQNILAMSQPKLRAIRGKEIGLIFQNPLASLNPVYTIGNQLIETIRLHHRELSVKDARDKAIDLLQKVGISDPASRLSYYPHQFSLGMCQRVVIALTLSMQPTLLIADEPTASLDVTVQAQILDLLCAIQAEFNMSILLISHDLGVIAQTCDHVLVMYRGHIVESGPKTEIVLSPRHPYTQALFAAIPSIHLDRPVAVKAKIAEPISPFDQPTGCVFCTRCPYATDKCRTQSPTLEDRGASKVACFFPLG